MHTLGDAGAGDEERNASAALLGVDFAFVQWVVVGDDFVATAAFHAAIIRGKDKVGVLNELMSRPAWVVGFFQVGDDLANVVIQGLNHTAVIRVVLAFE